MIEYFSFATFIRTKTWLTRGRQLFQEHIVFEYVPDRQFVLL